MWKNIVERGRAQMIWRMRIACWITKATNTHSESVNIIAFQLTQWLNEHPSVLHYTNIVSPLITEMESVYCAVPTFRLLIRFLTRRLVATLSSLRAGHDPTSGCVGFVVNKEALKQDLPTVFRLSPVSIIPPLPYTHSSIYHPRCTILFSQYFSFPQSVSLHHCSILIHPSTTHTV